MGDWTPSEIIIHSKLETAILQLEEGDLLLIKYPHSLDPDIVKMVCKRTQEVAQKTGVENVGIFAISNAIDIDILPSVKKLRELEKKMEELQREITQLRFPPVGE